MAYLMIWQRKKQVYRLAGNNEFKKKDNIDSVESSLKSHPLWVNLYVFETKFNIWATRIS